MSFRSAALGKCIPPASVGGNARLGLPWSRRFKQGISPITNGIGSSKSIPQRVGFLAACELRSYRSAHRMLIKGTST